MPPQILRGGPRMLPGCSTLDGMDKAAALREILNEDPANAFARYGLALELAGRGETTEALAEFDTLLEHNPGYVPAYQMAGQTLLDLHEPARARQYLTRGLAAADASGNTHAAREISGLLDATE